MNRILYSCRPRHRKTYPPACSKALSGWMFFHLFHPAQLSCGREERTRPRKKNRCAAWSNYPLVNIQKAIENGHRNSGFSHLKWWFSIAMLVYQRVTLHVRHLHLDGPWVNTSCLFCCCDFSGRCKSKNTKMKHKHPWPASYHYIYIIIYYFDLSCACRLHFFPMVFFECGKYGQTSC